MRLGTALTELHQAESALAEELRAVGERHAVEHDVWHLCATLADQCQDHAERLRQAAARYDEQLPEREPPQPPSGVLLRDLRRLYLLACECEIDWEMVTQGAKAARDRDLLATASHCLEQTTVQVKWLKTRIKEASPQALTVG
jgi:hypothetical protein